METVTETQLERRLDDFRADVDHRFDAAGKRADRFEAELVRLRSEMKAGFERMDDRFARIDDRFERMDDRFERLHHLLFAAAAGVIVALIGLIATQL